MPKKPLIAFCLLLLCTAGKAQNFPSDSALTRIFQSDVLLPLLVDSAVKNSPEIRRSAKNVAVVEQNLQAAKKSILNGVSLAASYGYGNTGSIALDKDLSTFNQVSSFNNIRASRFNIGFNIQLPLSSLLSRKNITRAAELQIDMAEEERANAVLFIKQQVIKLYQDLKLAHLHMLTGVKVRQSASVSANMAQKNFLDGQLTVEQISKQQNDYNQSVMDYDAQVNKFQTCFLLLEAYTGVQLAKLMNRVR